MLEQLYPGATRSFDEGDSESAGLIGRPFEKLCTQPREAGYLGIYVVDLDPEMLQTPVGAGIRVAHPLVGPSPRDVDNGAVGCLAPNKAVSGAPYKVFLYFAV